MKFFPKNTIVIKTIGGKMYKHNKKYLNILILLLLLVGCRFAFSQNSTGRQSQMIYVDGSGIEIEVDMTPGKPNLGDEVELRCIMLTPYKDIPRSKIVYTFYHGAQLTSGQKETVFSPLKKGMSAQAAIRFKIVSRLLQLNVGVRVEVPDGHGGKMWKAEHGKTIDMVILAEDDTISYEKYGHDLDLWSRIGPEYCYDIEAGARVRSFGRPYDEEAKRIRSEIEELKRLDPTLSDWDALELMHDVIYNMIWRYGIHDREKSIPILIQARKLMKEKGITKWEAVEEIIEGGEGSINFFRNDGSPNNIDSNTNSNYIPDQRTDITISGTIAYKKHLYDKIDGLDTATINMPLRNTKVWIRGYWFGSGGSHYYGPDITDDNGRYSITVQGVNTPGYFIPLVWLRGPNTPPGSQDFDRIKLYSDSLTFSFIPACEDSQNWRFRSKLETLWVSTNIGTKYCGEYPTDGQLWPNNQWPRSGAANIYDNLLSAYRFLRDSSYTTGDTLYRVVAKWEPDYEHATGIAMDYGQTVDTIYITGDTIGQHSSWHDEWDDWSSLHEYGHHVMIKCAPPFPPCSTWFHFWYLEYPNLGDKGLAYAEGWANFFAAGVSDSVCQVNTKKGIGRTTANDTTYYHNVENPWDGSHFNSSEFEGGPWCEGAVAGVLWDIYDGQNENPYPYYPDSNQGFVDTTSDLMSMLFRKNWNIFDDYDPPQDTILTCQTIYHFRGGWYSFDYGYGDSLYEIFYHHYIADSIPAAPIGLSANQEGKYVRLYWNKNSESDLKGYRVYRRMYNKTWGHWDDWAWRADNDSSIDTTYLDSKVISTIYRYRVTAYDSLGNESDYSDSVQINVKNGMEPEGIQLFSRSQTIFSNVQGMEISIPQESKEIIFKIYDCCGRIVNKQKIKLNSCDLLKINLRDAKNNHLPNGIYFLHLKVDNGDEVMSKFVVIR